jgi:hypothetical protein
LTGATAKFPRSIGFHGEESPIGQHQITEIPQAYDHHHHLNIGKENQCARGFLLLAFSCLAAGGCMFVYGHAIA